MVCCLSTVKEIDNFILVFVCRFGLALKAAFIER